MSSTMKIQNRKGTIAWLLSKNRDYIGFDRLSDNKSMEFTYNKVMELLKSPELIDKKAVEEARKRLTIAKRNLSNFASTLWTYFSGDKVIK